MICNIQSNLIRMYGKGMFHLNCTLPFTHFRPPRPFVKQLKPVLHCRMKQGFLRPCNATVACYVNLSMHEWVGVAGTLFQICHVVSAVVGGRHNVRCLSQRFVKITGRICQQKHASTAMVKPATTAMVLINGWLYGESGFCATLLCTSDLRRLDNPWTGSTHEADLLNSKYSWEAYRSFSLKCGCVCFKNYSLVVQVTFMNGVCFKATSTIINGERLSLVYAEWSRGQTS